MNLPKVTELRGAEQELELEEDGVWDWAWEEQRKYLG